MYDSVESISQYGSLPEEIEKECEKICEGKTIKDLRQVSDYFSNKASNMQRAIEEEVTYDDFQDKKKMTDLELPTEQE